MISGLEVTVGNLFGSGGIFGGADAVVTALIVLLMFAIVAFRNSASLDLIMAFFTTVIFGMAAYNFLPLWIGVLALIGSGAMFTMGVLNLLAK